MQNRIRLAAVASIVPAVVALGLVTAPSADAAPHVKKQRHAMKNHGRPIQPPHVYVPQVEDPPLPPSGSPYQLPDPPCPTV